ncbi:MAG: hypothetical protein J5482_01160 [Oscillospiraceae bacterium]|nr:hypothetical protein [Oscillospiraceae bacterium]
MENVKEVLLENGKKALDAAEQAVTSVTEKTTMLVKSAGNKVRGLADRKRETMLLIVAAASVLVAAGAMLWYLLGRKR